MKTDGLETLLFAPRASVDYERERKAVETRKREDARKEALLENKLGWRGDPDLKDRTIQKMRKYRETGQLVQLGEPRNGEQGDPVECLTKSTDLMNDGYKKYETMFGIPASLASLKNMIFDNLPPKEAQRWPERFLKSVPVNADFEGAEERLALARLKEVLNFSDSWDENVRDKAVAAVEKVIDALESGGNREAIAENVRHVNREIEDLYLKFCLQQDGEPRVWAAQLAVASARWSVQASARWSVQASAMSGHASAEAAADSLMNAGACSLNIAWSREANRVIKELENLPEF